MTSQDVEKWLHCQDFAKKCKVTIILKNRFELIDKNKMILAFCQTVEDFHAFLCGYEHFTHTREFKKR
jgi:hypothetical protein